MGSDSIDLSFLAVLIGFMITAPGARFNRAICLLGDSTFKSLAAQYPRFVGRFAKSIESDPIDP
jgi:hypothetical protein